MIIFLTIFYLILCFIYVIFKPKKKRLCFLSQFGKENRVFKSFNNNFMFFCSRTSIQYEIINLARQSQIILKSQQDYLKIIEPLKNSGIDVNKCIYKIELYKNFNIDNVILKLSAFKKLQDKGFDFNLFIFVNDYKLLKTFLKIAEAFSFKKSSVVRVCNCLDVDYKILCAVNFLNLLEPENKVILNSKMGNLKPLNLNKKFIQNKRCNNQNCIRVFQNEQYLSFENFEYKNHFYKSQITNNLVQYSLLKTYDYNNFCQVYKFVAKNDSFNFLSIKLNIGTLFSKIAPKNNIYVCEIKKEYVSIVDKINNRKVNIVANNLQVVEDNNQNIYAIKSFVIKPKSEEVFYFLTVDDSQNIKELANQNNEKLQILFDECLKKYSNIDMIKINSKNKIINNLVNDYLPQKIIKKFILEPNKYYSDFYNLLNQRFDVTLINKKFVEGNLAKFYLINKGLFCAYQNLIYFYVGGYCDKFGLNLNLDKSLIFDNSQISCFKDKNYKTFIFKNYNLDGEVKINNIMYSNLKFVNFDSIKDNLEIYY